MAGEWEDLILGDLGRVVTGKTPLTAVEGNFGGQIPFVTPSDMDGRKTICTTARNLTEIGAASVKGSKVPAGSVMVSCIGSDMGKAVIAGRDCVTNQQINSIVVDERFSSEFVYYNLSTRKHEIRHQAAGGSAQPILNKGDFSRLGITLPPLAEQKAIATVLGALDDKIELNRRMNATLEAMARALFQSWFVDFDPVRAKLDGRPTAALFPASFQKSSLGNIPQGWTAGNFGNVIVPARERIGDSEAVVLSAVSSSQLVRSDEHFKKQVYSKSISNYLKVRRWDFAYNPSRINIGSIGMLKENAIGAVSPVYEVFRPASTYHWFVDRALAQPDTKIWIQTLCSGSVRQSLKLKDLQSIPLVVPPLPIVQAFNKVWEEWHELIRINEKQSRALATLRDTLLPKLLSGELTANETSKPTN